MGLRNRATAPLRAFHSERQGSATPRPGCLQIRFFALDSRPLALTSLLIVLGAGRGAL